MQLLLQRVHRRGAAGRLDRLRRLDHGGGDGGGARGADDVANRPGRQDAVDGEERGGGRHGGGGAGWPRGLAIAMPRLLRADRAPGIRPVVRGIGVVAPRLRRHVILRAVGALQLLLKALGRVAVQVAVIVAGYTGTVVQRTRRLRHGRT